jgi:CBS-domain-containing membrane protein
LHLFLEQIASDYMTRDVTTVTRDTTIRELGWMFKQNDHNGYPVQEASQVVGFVTKFDYLACFEFTPARMVPHYDELMKRTVADVMTPEFIYVRSDTKMTRVLQLMVHHHLRSMPIIDDNQRLAGMISREDVIRALERCAEQEA